MRFKIKGIEIAVDEKNIVTWMSDWTKVYELRDEGYFTMTFYPHSYGHCEFTLSDQCTHFKPI